MDGGWYGLVRKENGRWGSVEMDMIAIGLSNLSVTTQIYTKGMERRRQKVWKEGEKEMN